MKESDKVVLVFLEITKISLFILGILFGVFYGTFLDKINPDIYKFIREIYKEPIETKEESKTETIRLQGRIIVANYGPVDVVINDKLYRITEKEVDFKTDTKTPKGGTRFYK